MKWLKIFEEYKTKKELKGFCEIYLAHLLDDETYILKIEEEKSHTIVDDRSEFYSKKRNQSIIIRPNRRSDVITLSRNKIKFNPRYTNNQEIKSIPFNWKEIENEFVPFFLMLNEHYTIKLITLYGLNKEVIGIKIDDIEDLNQRLEHEKIMEIIITVKR